MKKRPSPAFELVKLVWDCKCVEVAHSWRVINSSMQRALKLAIEAGLAFKDGDFETIFNTMRGEYWFPLFASSRGEGFYVTACESGNGSACRSFEAWKQRPPFILAGKRLHHGSTLAWGDARYCVVTSFSEDGQSLTACSYKEPAPGDAYGPEHKIDKRITITIEELRAEETKNRKASKQRQDTAKILRGLQYEPGCREVTAEAVNAWTSEQRKEVLAWLQLVGWDERNAKRPTFLPAKAA
jgi:hypothetical protein